MYVIFSSDVFQHLNKVRQIIINSSKEIALYMVLP